MSDSLGLVDFAIGLVNSVLTCPTGRRTVKSILLVKKLMGLVEMTSGLVNASFSLPEWQAVKMIFFAPCKVTVMYGCGENLKFFQQCRTSEVRGNSFISINPEKIFSIVYHHSVSFFMQKCDLKHDYYRNLCVLLTQRLEVVF